MLELKYRHYCNECPLGFIPGRIKIKSPEQ